MKKTLAALAFLASGPAFSMGCEFVTDPANDEGVGPADLLGTYLSDDGEKLTVTTQIGAPVDTANGMRYITYLRYTDGQQWMFEFDYTLTTSGAGVFSTGWVATWTEDGGSYSADYANAINPEVTIDGDTMSMTVPLAAIGNPNAQAQGFTTVIAGVLFTDRSDEGIYTFGSSCGKAVEVAETADSEKMGGCGVVTDAALDFLPQYDVVNVDMFKTGSKIGATITMTDMNPPIVDGEYIVHWVDETGNGYFMGVGVNFADFGQGMLEVALPDIGTYNPADGSYTWNPDAEGEAYGDGNSLTIVVDEKFLGYPTGTLSGVGAVTTEYYSGEYPYYYDTTANDGEWMVGDSCTKAEEQYMSLADAMTKAVDTSNTAVTAAGAGSFGWLMLMAGLVGLRRRR